MLRSNDNAEDTINVRVAHDLKRQILEVPSLIRVMNNYYDKKIEIQDQIRPLLLKSFKESLKAVKEKDQDWLFSVPTALSTLSDDFIRNKDSFRFPDSIILFEAWMNLGLDALYPRYVFHFKFPGFLKGEKTRNVFQFIYATSRGFGFPLNFGPEFYEYKFKIRKSMEIFLKWIYIINHLANQGIYSIGDKKFKMKRHHPGEFESVIISEYENGEGKKIFKGIDTLLHGYFTNDPKTLGVFETLKQVLQNTNFFYTIGDHAMSIEKKKNDTLKTISLPLFMHDQIVRNYDVDFYSYIEKVMETNVLLTKKINFYKKKRKELINQLKFVEKIKFRFEQSKRLYIFAVRLSKQYPEIEKYRMYKSLLEKLRELLFTTPLYTHTIHIPTKEEKKAYKFASDKDHSEDFEQESINSILLTYMKKYQKDHDFIFEEKEVISGLKDLRDQMAKMWLYFKERHFRFASKKLSEITSLSLTDPDYKIKIKNYLDKIIPIISLYEIFQRPLSESVYPESKPETRSQLSVAMARFLTSKYNPIGINIMDMLNRMAYHNWCHFIKKKKLTIKEFFKSLLRLPIWKHIPTEVKMKILND